MMQSRAYLIVVVIYYLL